MLVVKTEVESDPVSYLTVTDSPFSCVQVESSCWTSMRSRYISRTTIQKFKFIISIGDECLGTPSNFFFKVVCEVLKMHI